MLVICALIVFQFFDFYAKMANFANVINFLLSIACSNIPVFRAIIVTWYNTCINKPTAEKKKKAKTKERTSD